MPLKTGLVLAALTCLLTSTASIARNTDNLTFRPEAHNLGQRHAALVALSGTWAVTETLTLTPDAQPARSQGRATFEALLDGRQIRQTLRIVSAQKNFQGLGLIGYDDISERYYSIWNDTTFTGVIVTYGFFNGTNTYEFTGEINGETKQSPKVPLREVMTITDKDHFSFAYFETRDGLERRTVLLSYTRLES